MCFIWLFHVSLDIATLRCYTSISDGFINCQFTIFMVTWFNFESWEFIKSVSSVKSETERNHGVRELTDAVNLDKYFLKFGQMH